MPDGSGEMPTSQWGLTTWRWPTARPPCPSAGPDEAAYFYIGNARLLSGNFEQAIGDFDSAIGCNSDSGRAYYARALAKELKGDSEGSGLDYRRARDLGFDEAA